jgi:hypothetical protein
MTAAECATTYADWAVSKAASHAARAVAEVDTDCAAWAAAYASRAARAAKHIARVAAAEEGDEE